MTPLDIAVAVTVTVSLTMIAAVDARQMMIDGRLVALLAAAALLWHLAGAGLTIIGETGYQVAAAALLGVAVIAIPIAVAELLGRRWPAGGGDAPLLGAIGLLLGVGGLLWALIAGAMLGLVHRGCLQRKRGRPFAKGQLPAGPGFCAGAILVFLALLASGAARAETAAPAAPPETVSAGRIAAVELPPEPFVLPPPLADRQVAVLLADPVPFERLVAELERASGLPVIIEERPARTSGGGMELPDPPRLSWTFEGSLQDLLWSVRALAGYAAELHGEELVLYRHWDAEWRLPKGFAPLAAADPEPAPGLFASLESWLGRLLGGGTKEPDGDGSAEPPPSASSEAPAESASTEAAPPESAPVGTTPAAAPTETPAADEAGDPPPAPADIWPVRVAEHETLEGVLESWSETAGWTLVYRARQRYALSADAEFEGDFLAAVDQLLTDAATRRSLSATAHARNRHLVVEDVEGVQ